MFLYEDKDLFKDEKDYMEMPSIKRSIYRFIEQRLLGNLGEIELLIFRGRELGLPKDTIKYALIDIDYNEPQLACESIMTNMHEFDIKIDKEFYDLAMKNCDNLKIDKNKYQFLLELIDENQSSK